MNSPIYGSVVFNEVTRSDSVLRDIKACVIDSCIEVILTSSIRQLARVTTLESHETPQPCRY